MTANAKLICDCIGIGYVLRVPHDLNKPLRLISPPSYPKRRTPIRVSRAPFEEVKSLGLIAPLTKKGTRNKIGWRELQLPADQDGTAADIYVMIQ